MNRALKTYLVAALLSTSTLCGAPAAQSATGTELPLKSVVMTTSGLALYEHAGNVIDNQTLNLSVRLDGVDDVLKSLVVLDSNGTLGGVTLPGRTPLSQIFRDLPFDKNDLNSQVSLLNTLRGAEVHLDVDNIRGQLMNVSAEQERTRDGIVTHHRLSVLTKDGIKTAIIEDLGFLKFTDDEINEQLKYGLEALYDNRIQDRRNVEISLKGKGQRNVSMAYIQEAPLWKSSYRLVVPKDGAKDSKAILQGWAVLENTTGQDWDDVHVTLMSGSPVTYHQALYESYHVARPELPVKIMDRIMPRTDSGVMSGASYAEEALDESDAQYGRREAKKMDSRALYKTMGAGSLAMDSFSMAESNAPMPSAPQMAQTISAAASETASQMVFKFPHGIDLKAGHSLMLPYAQLNLPAEELYVYQPDTNPIHPLSSILIKNVSDSALPPGILTIYDRPQQKDMLHIGDAEMPLVPKNEDRLINFALDTHTKIDRATQNDRQLGLIKLNKGVLTQEVAYENTTIYTIKAPAEEGRTILLEQPLRHGWDLTGEWADKADKTLTHYRLRVDVKPNESKKVPVTLRNKGQETISLVNISPSDITARLRMSGSQISPRVKDALKKISTLRQDINTEEQALNQLRQERSRITQDQDRIRENLRSVSQNTAIGKRYLVNLDKQETQLENILNKEENIQASLTRRRNELSAYVNGLKLD
jgi:hypothetical protein|tara:strand:- start:272925 stop:275033 length:2109 start_codon:yes stop_codon:yes gene_type:complete